MKFKFGSKFCIFVYVKSKSKKSICSALSDETRNETINYVPKLNGLVYIVRYGSNKYIRNSWVKIIFFLWIKFLYEIWNPASKIWGECCKKGPDWKFYQKIFLQFGPFSQHLPVYHMMHTALRINYRFSTLEKNYKIIWFILKYWKSIKMKNKVYFYKNIILKYEDYSVFLAVISTNFFWMSSNFFSSMSNNSC